MIIKAIIVDDEKASRENLLLMIQNLSPKSILFEAKDVMEAKAIIDKEMPKVIFLDINMPLYSGFDLLEIIDCKNHIIILVTAHINHSLKAIKLKVFDFLLKPFGFSTLKNTLERINEELMKKNEIEAAPKKIAFKTRNEIYYVDPHEIAYCESDNNYTTVIFTNKKKILLSKSIKSIEEELIDFSFLFRVHRSYIINIDHLSKYNIGEGYVFLLEDTIQIPVSDRRKKQFSLLIKT